MWSRSVRSRTAATAWPGWTGGSCSSATPCRASGCGSPSRTPPTTASGGPTPSRSSRPVRTGWTPLPVRRPRQVRGLRLPARQPGRATTAQEGRAGRAAAPAGRHRLGRGAGAGRHRRHRGRTALADPDALPGRRRGTRRAPAAPSATRSSRSRPAAARSPTSTHRPVTEQTWAPDTELLAVAADPPTLLVDGRTEQGSAEITEHAVGRDWRLAADGFWQGHPGAAATLVEAVVDGLRPRAGERAFDLYCGVGLFAGALVDAGVRTWGIEWSRSAIVHARRNVPGARFTAGKVERAVRTLPKRTDLVVLDPPRTGAGKDVDRRDRRPPATGDRLRRLRSGRAGPRPPPGGDRRLPGEQHPRVRSVPDDPPPRSGASSTPDHPGSARR